MDLNDELKLQIWERGQIVEGKDPSKIRKDACDAWIKFDEYGNTKSPYGWQVDHIIPRKKLANEGFSCCAIDNIVNLRPLQWENNLSKGDDYPYYQSAKTADGEDNIARTRELVVNGEVQKELADFYKLEEK